MSQSTEAESNSKASGLSALVGRIFPKTPDFFSLLQDQSAQAVRGFEALVEYMGDGSKKLGKAVKAVEAESDEIRDRSMEALNSAFSTPMDREDLYRAIATLDHLLGYAKSTVREMEVLGVTPDEHSQAMAAELLAGVTALDQGYAILASETAKAEGFAQAARTSERAIEKLYRKAISDLFDVEKDLKTMDKLDGPTGPTALVTVVDMFKRREIYRHLSNAGDRVARAGEALHDIVVKMV